MTSPLVTVICLCYNHSHFLREAVESVLNQTYKNIQIIIADDASTDDSVQKIKNLKQNHPSLELLLLPQNEGNCKAFNKAMKLAKGDFIIDFSTDDCMFPDRVEKQVNLFQSLSNEYGVVFTDAIYVNENGGFLYNHFDYLRSKKLLEAVPQGDVYETIISRYFMASPTMMVRRCVFDDLKGYDETLTYEDFDFWVRSARNYKYAFLDEKLTKIRKSGASMSTGWYKKGDQQLHSTYVVCKKIKELNRNDTENRALLKRIRFEIRQAVFSENLDEANYFYKLLTEIEKPTRMDKLVISLGQVHLPLSFLRNLYHRLRFS